MRLGTALLSALALACSAPAVAQDYRSRLPQDEVIYFLLPDRFENGDTANDRGGLSGDRLATGFDLAHKGFFHGGDLKGLVSRLDYIQGLGATAIWLAPVFKNKPVQGPPGQESAGYHGYWVTDFTRVDPHFGTNEDFKAFVDAAHARGMKVYMDIITNHSADVIQLAECAGTGRCDYRGIADYPYQRRGGVNGAPINPGFAGESDRSAANFARLTDPNYAYTVRVPEAEKAVKVPAWLNDPIHYHNRGDSLFRGESNTLGDFVGLDDLFTEHPRVVQGMIDIYGSWIDRFGIDGFRIDTARHVNPEFWQQFVPAMLERARANGIPNFHIFGEVANDEFQPGKVAQHTRRDKLPAALDFAFKEGALRTIAGGQPTEVWRDFFSQDVLYEGGEVANDEFQPGKVAQHTRRDKLPAALDFAFKEGALRTIAGGQPTEVWRDFFSQDVLYEGGEAAVLQLPTFIGNHDMGRFAYHVRRGFPNANDEEVLKRVMLGHVLMLTARGVPTIYSGDEQGFAGDGGDQDAREDMFPSRVAIYNDNRLVGTGATTAQSNFDTSHPLYRMIRELSGIRRASPALRHGATVFRAGSDDPGLLAFSRILDGREVLVAINTSTRAIEQNVVVDVDSIDFTALAGPCPARATAPGSVRISLPPLGFAICDAR